MPFISAANVCQAELIYTWAGQTVETVLHYEAEDAVSPSRMNEAAAALKTWYNTSLKPLHSNTISLVQIKMTDLNTDIAPVVNYTTGLPITGFVTGDCLPNNCALVLTKRTVLRGRSYRGRIYHGAIPEASCAGNTVTGSIVTSLLAAYTLILSLALTDDTWHMCIVSRQHNNVPLTEAVVTRLIGLDSDGMIDSQRRRLPGRGA
jgi:hypothetical protein